MDPTVGTMLPDGLTGLPPGISAAAALVAGRLLKRVMGSGVKRKGILALLPHVVGILDWIAGGLAGGLSLQEAAIRAGAGLLQGFATSGAHSQVKVAQEIVQERKTPLVNG